MGKSLRELFENGNINDLISENKYTEQAGIPVEGISGNTMSQRFDIQNSKNISVSFSSPLMKSISSLANKLRKKGERTSETFLEEELTGLRPLRVLANPIIYGTDIIRLTTKSTPMLERMKESRAGIGSNVDITKQNSGGLTGFGQKIQNIETRINNQVLGIHNPLNPTEYYKQFEGDPVYQRDIKIAEIKDKYKDTGLSKLFSNARGNLSTATNQIAGNAINAAKQAVTKAIFGKSNPLNNSTGGNLDTTNSVRNANVYWQAEGQTYSKKSKTNDNGIKQIYDGKTIDTSGTKYIPYNTRPNIVKDVISKIKTDSPYRKIKDSTIYGNLENDLENGRGLGIRRDVLNQLGRLKMGELDSIKYNGDTLEKVDLIPLRFQKMNDKSAIYMRAVISGFNETFNAGWESQKFLGNPFSFYSYTGVERKLTFTLKVYAMSQIELTMMWNRLEYLAKLAYPHEYIGSYGVEPSLFYFTLGSLYVDKPAILNSLTYTIEENEQLWETGGNSDGMIGGTIQGSEYESSFGSTFKTGPNIADNKKSFERNLEASVMSKTSTKTPTLNNQGISAGSFNFSGNIPSPKTPINNLNAIGISTPAAAFNYASKANTGLPSTDTNINSLNNSQTDAFDSYRKYMFENDNYDGAGAFVRTLSVNNLTPNKFKLPKFITAQIEITFLESKNNTQNNLYGFGKTITSGVTT